MDFNIADVVISLNGRDKNKHFIVTHTDDVFLTLVDGKGRKLEKPKRKKNKHVKHSDGTIDIKLAEKLQAGEKVTNKEIRKALAEYTVSKEAEERI